MYIPQLDLLRLVLFFYILISHSFVDEKIVFEHAWITSFYRTGWIGVQGFFVLSGFIITRSLLKELKNNGVISFKYFYARRALKIIPPFFVVVIVILLLSKTEFFTQSLVWNHLPGSTESFVAGLKELPYFLLFVGNIPLALGYIVNTTPAILISWTLAVEEQFYLIQPIFLVWAASCKITTSRVSHILLGVVALSLIIRCWTAYFYDEDFYRNFNNTFTLTQIDSICIGALIALNLYGPNGELSVLSKKISSLHAACCFFTLTVLLVALSWMINYSVAVTYTIGFTLINIFFGLIILCLAIHPVAQIQQNIFSRLGRNGYCLYLTHTIALIIAYELLKPNLVSEIPAIALYWARILFAIVISILLARVLYLISEAPFQKRMESLRKC